MSGDLPWGLVKPLGAKVDFDPTEHEHAKPFFVYSVEEGAPGDAGARPAATPLVAPPRVNVGERAPLIRLGGG